MRRRKYKPWKSGGGCGGSKIEDADRDEAGRVAATNRQLEIVNAIREITGEQGYPPTVRELQSRFGFASPHGIACQLRVLRRKGWVTWVEGLNRTLRAVGE